MRSLARLAWASIASLLAACSNQNAGFPADHCADDCVTPDQQLVIEPANSLLLVGSERRLTAMVLSPDGSRRDVTASVIWSSGDPQVFTVSADGTAAGVAPGQGVITARLPTLSAEARVVVSGQSVQQVRVSPIYERVTPGLTQQYKATAVLTDGAEVDITNHAGWSTSNGAVASIDAHGAAQGLAAGVTRVIAHYAGIASDVTGNAAMTVRPDSVTIESFLVEPAQVLALPGSQVAFHAIAITSANDRVDVSSDVSWQTSNPTIATVDASGMASALAAGDANIQATLTYHSQTYVSAGRLRVVSPSVTALRVAPQWSGVLVGQQQAYRATAVLADSSEVDVTGRVHWASDAPGVAEVTLDGVATGLTTGRARISASFTLQGTEFSDGGVLQVAERSPTLASLAVLPIDDHVLVDDDLQYQCIATMSDGSTSDATDRCDWSVEDDTVAVIDAGSGLLSGLAPGSTRVNARLVYLGVTALASTQVEVRQPIGIDSLQVTPAAAATVVGSSVAYRAHLVFSNGDKLDVTPNVAWTSDNNDVAHVDSLGVGHALAPGITSIHATATYLGVEYTDFALLRVSPPAVVVTEFRIVPPRQFVDIGNSAGFEAQLLMSNGEQVDVTRDVHWVSQNSDIAASTRVAGEFVGLAPGTATLRADFSYQGATYTSNAELRVVDTNVIVGLELQPPAPLLSIGGQQQMQASLLLRNGAAVDVTRRGSWSSSNPAVAVIDAFGEVRALTAGESVITKTLSVGNQSAQATVRVVDPRTQLVALRVAPAEQTVLIGDEVRFTASAIYLDGSRVDVSVPATWEVADPAIADVASQEGMILGIAAGATTVTTHYFTNGVELTDTAQIVVEPAPVTITSIDVTPAHQQVAAGNSADFTATAVLSDHRRVDVTGLVQWQSSNTAIAGASTNPGEFLTSTAGTATISATLVHLAQPVVGRATLTVTAPAPSYLELAPPQLRLTVGAQASLQAIVHYTDGSTEDVTRASWWQSAAPAVARVTSTLTPGRVTAMSAGTTTITATYHESLSASASVQVVEPALLSIELIPGSTHIAAGVIQRFTAIGTYDDESTQDITERAFWTSSDESVATIEPGEIQGAARGVAQGLATISATLDGVTGTADLAVTEATVVSVQIGPGDARIRVGQTQPFIAIARLSDGSRREVTTEATWVSSDSAVASVSNDADTAGTALGLAAGSTVIRAWYQAAVSNDATLVVTAAPVTALLVTPQDVTVTAGSPVYYTATAVLGDTTQIEITRLASWESSNTQVATVSNGLNKGLATTLTTGTTTILARLGSQTGQASLTVTGACKGKEDSIVIVRDITVRVGGTAQLQVVGIFSDGCQQDLTNDSSTVWKSSDDDVFTVGNKTGVVKGIGEGVASVEVKHRGNTDTATVTVVP